MHIFDILDFLKFDIIYARLHAIGTTLVIVKEEILGKSGRVIPSILDYEKHIKAACTIHLLYFQSMLLY
jgi:phosphoserine aminotransferase